jgi:hypothetical protein
MDLQTGKLYWMNNKFWRTARWVPSELIVIIDISEERNRITYYRIDTGRLYSLFFDDFKTYSVLSLT